MIRHALVLVLHYSRLLLFGVENTPSGHQRPHPDGKPSFAERRPWSAHQWWRSNPPDLPFGTRREPEDFPRRQDIFSTLDAPVPTRSSVRPSSVAHRNKSLSPCCWKTSPRNWSSRSGLWTTRLPALPSHRKPRFQQGRANCLMLMTKVAIHPTASASSLFAAASTYRKGITATKSLRLDLRPRQEVLYRARQRLHRLPLPALG